MIISRKYLIFCYKKRKSFAKPSRSYSTAINSQLDPAGHSFSVTRSVARSSQIASERNVIRFRILNLQASAHVPADAAGRSASRFDRRDGSYTSSTSASAAIARPCFSRWSPVIDVSERPNFRVVTGMGRPAAPRAGLVLREGVTERKLSQERMRNIVARVSVSRNLGRVRVFHERQVNFLASRSSRFPRRRNSAGIGFRRTYTRTTLRNTTLQNFSFYIP